MSCERYLELLSGHIDGVNNEEQERELQAHLKDCAHCRARLESYRQMEQGIGELTQEVPEGFAAGVMARLPARKAARRRAVWLRPLFGAAAAALVLLVGLRMLPDEAAQKQEDPPAPERAMDFCAVPYVDSLDADEADGTLKAASAAPDGGAIEGNPYASMYDWIEKTQTSAETSDEPSGIYGYYAMAAGNTYSERSLLGRERNCYPVLCIYGLKSEFVHQLSGLPKFERTDGLVQYSTTYAVLEEIMHEYTQYVSWSYPSKDDTPQEDDTALIVWFPLDYEIPQDYIY